VLILTENDYSLLEDIKRFLEEIVPDNARHTIKHGHILQKAFTFT
jgi:thiamine phosphate synthase YjbQ (UPF0047 family)